MVSGANKRNPLGQTTLGGAQDTHFLIDSSPSLHEVETLIPVLQIDREKTSGGQVTFLRSPSRLSGAGYLFPVTHGFWFLASVVAALGEDRELFSTDHHAPGLLGLWFV